MKINFKDVFIQKFISVFIPLFLVFTCHSFLSEILPNTFSFDFYMDDEAPVIKEVSYEKIYDKTLKKDRYYITMIIYDNHYVQSISPLIFNSSSIE